ncbi:MAG: Nif3-like dinuclear metal center hexameric protein [Desulfobacterales bacterium]|nr:Nif3-like dinuclear metal center hexameric protein [Desulfobacterales bacterium]
MGTTVADIISAMHVIAPPELAESWDNCGLQAGDKSWPVKKVCLSLDPTPDVISAACKAGADMLITHHPLIFSPLNSLDFSSQVGAAVLQSANTKMAIYSAHTNLDKVSGGINDVLAERIGLINVCPFIQGFDEMYKFVVYVPAESEQAILKALFETDAGKIGKYSGCSFRTKGTGTFIPDSDAEPYIGQFGEVSHVEEIRIEAVVSKNEINNVVAHVRKHHPYERMAYDIFPMVDSESVHGLGRMGALKQKTTLKNLALDIKGKLELETVKVAGDPDLVVTDVALCSGSGSSLLNDFYASGAQAYISGDLKFHDARDTSEQNLGLIDIGHFASEHLMVEVLADMLKKVCLENKMDIEINVSDQEADPFYML